MESPVETPGASRPERAATSSPNSRTYSMSSDRHFGGHGSLLTPPTIISPEPMFIAASAASQIVTNDHDSHSSLWFDQHGIEPSGETALVASGALSLVNGFLDQLLFNFLSTARSTSLASLRPAVSEVLKPKLARDAISGADQELHEYLGGGEDEELLAFHNGLEPSGDWDLELVWKRTRLRCMVYSSLGDMEEEDEDMYTEQEQLDGPPGNRNRFSNTSGVVSPAVAIFLTSILEFMGEQALIVAGQTAYHRLRAKHDRDEREGILPPSEIADRVVVDENDMEKVALDRTLGRLWRGWRKRIRSPAASVSMVRSLSDDSIRSVEHSKGISDIANERVAEEEPAREQPTHTAAVPVVAIPVVPLHGASSHEESTTEEAVREQEDTDITQPAEKTEDDEYAAAIPLPIHEDDVREIETPWLRIHPEDMELDLASPERSANLPAKRRPKSLLIIPNFERGLPTPERSQPSSPTFLLPVSRKRSFPMHSPAPSLSAKRPRASPEDSTVEQTSDNETELMDAERTIDTKQEDSFVVMETENGLVAVSKPSATEKLLSDGDDQSEYSEYSETEDEEKPEHSNKAMIAGMVAGATAIGAAAITGIVAAAKGEAPSTNAAAEDSDAGEDLAEEPQILTSSRISIGGRISPDGQVGLSRASSVRSHSVHSLRLVDVASPRSPARSRHGSIDAADYLGARGPWNRGANSISPNATDINRVSSPIQRASTASPTMRNGTASPITIVRTSSAMSARHIRRSTENSISEVDESSSADESTPVQLALPDRSPLRGSGTFSQRTRSFEIPSPIEVPIPQPSATVNPGSYSEPQFVLAAAPTPRGSREVKSKSEVDLNGTSGTASSHITQTVLSAPSQGLKAPGHDSLGSVPPLTPLREMMEGAPDTSDEASSIAPSLDGASDAPSCYSPHRKSFDNSRPSYEMPVQQQQAARFSPVQMVRDDDITPKPESYSKPTRTLHTSGSSSSVTSISKLKAMRSSEESAKSDKGRSFEELIHSDQTIQYTLTPDTMRNIESQPKSPTVATVSRNGILPQVSNGTGPVNDPSMARTNNSVTNFSGLNMNPPPQIAKKPAPVVPSSKAYSGLSRPASNTSATRRPGAPVARDARVEREPLDDFAEFIRSTGPPGAVMPAPSSLRGVNGVASRNVSASALRTAGPAPATARSTSSASRNRYQAREPVVPYGGSSSDLIDFIRQGPPSANSRDNPRIPRTVAPFRTTMDSDQMVGAISSKVPDGALDARNSQASTEASVQPSMHSSVTSQSALLSNNYKTTAKLTPVQKSNMFDEEDMMPKRKTRRVRDPYAIDFSDEEDEYEAVAPKKPVKAEESLMDFLNSVPPPPPQPTTPFIISQTAQQPVAKKNSSISLMSRFGRRDSNTPSIKPQSSHSSRSQPTRSSSGAPQISHPQNHPIAAKYSTSSSPSGYGNASNYVAQLDSERKPGASRVAQKQYQAREAVLPVRKHQSATEELADFLRNTPPPPSMAPRNPEPYALNNQKSTSSFSNMFGRKKKMAAV